jgi:hypothetical protein
MTDSANHPTSNSDPGSDAHNPNRRLVDVARVEMLLTNGQLAMRRNSTLWGSNYAILVIVNDGELQTTAVYKPQRGERPLWDFPDGTLCYREMLAYWVSKTLGWHLVPPTVLRSGPHGLGSVQLFVEHNPEINYFSLDERFEEQLRRFVAFDYLVNNTDRKGGHLLLDPQGKLWGIDHGLTFHAAPKLRTVIWEFAGQLIAESMVEDVQKLRDQLESEQSDLYCRLVERLSGHEITALRLLVRHLIESKRYPSPGPGPNHPWPPV